MMDMIRSFSAPAAEEQSLAGGKGGTLARLTKPATQSQMALSSCSQPWQVTV